MATILSFTPRATTSSRPPLAAEASVIIFPGVRYERPNEIGSRRHGTEVSVSKGMEPTAPRH